MATGFDASDVQRQLDKKGLAGLKELCEKKKNEWKSVPLNVAITGNSGTGKSSFINASRGLTGDDRSAAKVDEVEGTTKVQPYRHPTHPNLLFWDLPGVGTPAFPKDSYLRQIEFQRYDFFFILSKDRFTENDQWLANEVKHLEKKYYFVRTKIDSAIRDDKDAHPRTHNEEALIQNIRQDCAKKLSSGQKIFLISNHKPDLYDFRKTMEILITDCPALKREAMILTLSARTEKIIKQKANALRGRIWHRASLAALGCVIPLLGFGVDYAIITDEMEFYLKQFGLDDESLESAIENSGCYRNLAEIKKEYEDVLTILSGDQLSKAIKGHMGRTGAMKALGTWLPVVGQILGGTVGGIAIASFLQGQINTLERAALAINCRILGKVF